MWIDAITQKAREGGRTVNVHALIATGVNVGGKREILGLDVATCEDGAGWRAFLRGLAARGLFGVQLVTSDCHHELRDAIASVLPGASWQRWRAHYTPQPGHQGPQVRPALGGDADPDHLRAAAGMPVLIVVPVPLVRSIVRVVATALGPGILLDATVVRALLVPGRVAILGRAR